MTLHGHMPDYVEGNCCQTIKVCLIYVGQEMKNAKNTKTSWFKFTFSDMGNQKGLEKIE